jgi:transposase
MRPLPQGRGRQGKRSIGGSLGAALPHPAFVEQQRKIRRHRDAIDAALEHGPGQGLIESTNTKLRVSTRMAFGFRSPDALIALGMLALGGYRPSLPGRAAAC